MTAERTTAPKMFERENVRKTYGRVRRTMGYKTNREIQDIMKEADNVRFKTKHSKKDFIIMLKACKNQ